MKARPEVDGVAVLAHALQRCSFFRVVVPSRTPRGRRLSIEYWASQILRVVLPLVGGATELRATGHWIDGKRHWITEAVRLLDFYVPRPFSRDVAVGLAVALESIAVQMHQEALAIAVEHRLHLMRPCVRQVAPRGSPSRRRFIERLATTASIARSGGRAARSSNA